MLVSGNTLSVTLNIAGKATGTCTNNNELNAQVYKALCCISIDVFVNVQLCASCKGF